MFSYYGSKSKVVNLYPSPKYKKIIEPFAGSARYSLKYWQNDVLLIDKYPVIVDLWKFLQSASEKDITSLPNVKRGDDIRKLNLDYGAFLLMGFMINRGSNQPKNIVADFQNWNKLKYRIAKDLVKIRHWKIVLGSYEDIENCEATWFIDPPYQYGGELYKEGSSNINYKYLGEWCQLRKGQSIVCENTKADWLPFYSMRKLSGQQHITTEAIWSNLLNDFQARQMELF